MMAHPVLAKLDGKRFWIGADGIGRVDLILSAVEVL